VSEAAEVARWLVWYARAQKLKASEVAEMAESLTGHFQRLGDAKGVAELRRVQRRARRHARPTFKVVK